MPADGPDRLQRVTPLVQPEYRESGTRVVNIQHASVYAHALQEARTEEVRVELEVRDSRAEEWEPVAVYWRGRPRYTESGELDIPYPSPAELVAVGQKLGARFVRAPIKTEIMQGERDHG